jgi:hypothetical protein
MITLYSKWPYKRTKATRVLFWQVVNNETGLTMKIMNLAEFLRDTGIVVDYKKLVKSIYRNNNFTNLEEFSIYRILKNREFDTTFEVVTKRKIRRDKVTGKKTYRHLTLRNGVIS